MAMPPAYSYYGGVSEPTFNQATWAAPAPVPALLAPPMQPTPHPAAAADLPWMQLPMPVCNGVAVLPRLPSLLADPAAAAYAPQSAGYAAPMGAYAPGPAAYPSKAAYAPQRRRPAQKKKGRRARTAEKPAAAPAKPARGAGRRWTALEHVRFLEGALQYGRKEWAAIQSVVGTKTVAQVRAHGYGSFSRYGSSTEALELALRNARAKLDATPASELEPQQPEPEPQVQQDDDEPASPPPELEPWPQAAAPAPAAAAAAAAAAQWPAAAAVMAPQPQYGMAVSDPDSSDSDLHGPLAGLEALAAAADVIERPSYLETVFRAKRAAAAAAVSESRRVRRRV